MNEADDTLQVRDLLDREGWTQKELGEKAGVSQSTVCRALGRVPARNSKPHRRLMHFIHEHATPPSSLASVLSEVWDGTPEHEAALAALIQCLVSAMAEDGGQSMTIPRRASDLRQQLRDLGLADSAIAAVWPTWWSEDADASSSAQADLAFTVARGFGLDPASLMSGGEPRFLWRGEVHDPARRRGRGRGRRGHRRRRRVP